MNPVKIKVMSDDFLVFSIPCGTFNIAFLNDYEFDYAVVLSPSIEADFYINTYSKRKDLMMDNYAAAISAAAFLTLERGLPLSEFSFETPFQKIDVFYTGNGIFNISIQKCKELYTKTTEISGCEIDYTDISLCGTVRVVKTKDIERFDLSALPGFLLAGKRIPDSVILTSKYDEKLTVSIYDEYNPTPLTTLHSYAAAAFIEKVPYKEKVFFSDNMSYFTKEYSAVTVSTKPTIIK